MDRFLISLIIYEFYNKYFIDLYHITYEIYTIFIFLLTTAKKFNKDYKIPFLIYL